MSDHEEQTSIDEIMDDRNEPQEERNGERSRELFGIGEIPNDWQVVEMDSCVEIIPGNSPPSATYNESGDGLPFFQGNAEFGHFHPNANTWCSEPRKTAEEDDILMSIRAPVGDLNIADRRCCIGRGLASLRPTDLNGLFLYYFLAKREAWLSRLATGSTFKSITKSDLEMLDIACPPLPEQRKIASILLNVDNAVQKTEEVIQQTRQVKMGIIQHVFTKGYNNHETEEDEKLGVVPKDWESGVLSDFADITMGNSPKSEYYNKEGEGIPFYQGNDDFGHIHPSTTVWCSKPVKEAEKGDILVSVRAPVGDINIAPERCCIGRGLAGIRPTDVNDTFLYYYLHERSRWLERIGSGSTFDSVNSKELKQTPVRIPPRQEQKNIGDMLSSVDKNIMVEQEYKENLYSLKQGLMQDLLTGEIRTTNREISVLPEVEKYD